MENVSCLQPVLSGDDCLPEGQFLYQGATFKTKGSHVGCSGRNSTSSSFGRTEGKDQLTVDQCDASSPVCYEV